MARFELTKSAFRSTLLDRPRAPDSPPPPLFPPHLPRRACLRCRFRSSTPRARRLRRCVPALRALLFAVAPAPSTRSHPLLRRPICEHDQAKRFTRFSELISSLRVAQADNNVARGKLVSQMHEVRALGCAAPFVRRIQSAHPTHSPPPFKNSTNTRR